MMAETYQLSQQDQIKISTGFDHNLAAYEVSEKLAPFFTYYHHSFISANPIGWDTDSTLI